MVSAGSIRTDRSRTPLEIVEELGLSNRIDVEALAARRCSYDSIHFGLHHVPIGSLITLIQDEPFLRPPRTAHIGNWDDIAKGRAGAMDFNKAICKWNLGYPLIYPFTKTETSRGSAGDCVYLPGSIVKNGQRKELAIHTWNGSRFIERERERPYLCPLVMVNLKGELIPLTELHWTVMQRIPGFDFVLETEVMTKHSAELRAMLSVLFETAGNSDQSRINLRDLISQSVAIDGTVTNCIIQKKDKGYTLDDCFFPSTEVLIEFILLTLDAAVRPREFFARIADLPPRLPLISNILMRIFSAIFKTHYPQESAPAHPFNFHLHWGARDMAGYPPRRMGYLMSYSKTRRMRQICKVLLQNFSDLQPICFAVLPASVFMLCPTSAHINDALLLSELFNTVNAYDNPGEDDCTLDRIEEATRIWRNRHLAELSPYFLNRFIPGSGVLHSADSLQESEPVEPPGFRALTFRQACAIVGTLTESAPTTGP